MRIRPLVTVCLAVALPLGCSKGASGPVQVPSDPHARCQAAHDHLVSLAEDTVPGDETEVHDIDNDLGGKDSDSWVQNCMTDQGKEAACALQATSLGAVDACNGTTPRRHWTIRVGVGECASLMSHTMDVTMSAHLEGGEMDPSERTNIVQQVEAGGVNQDDIDTCAKLAHSDVQCVLSAVDFNSLKTCGSQIAKSSPEFVSEMMGMAGGHAAH
jgi:hypothetical protein